jgi:hypothetical protein
MAVPSSLSGGSGAVAVLPLAAVAAGAGVVAAAAGVLSGVVVAGVQVAGVLQGELAAAGLGVHAHAAALAVPVGHHGRAVYTFLRDELGAGFIQFIPIIERATEASLPVADAGWGGRVKGRPLYTQEGNLVTHRSVGPAQYGRFLIEVFEEWVRRDIGTVYVQMFDTALPALARQARERLPDGLEAQLGRQGQTRNSLAFAACLPRH